MKLKLKYTDWEIRPKKQHDKICVARTQFDVYPKKTGVILKQSNQSSVFRRDRETGVILQKKNYTRILKQGD